MVEDDGRCMRKLSFNYPGWVAAIMVLCVTMIATPAFADRGALSVAVLNIEGRDIEPGLLRTLTGVLRHEAQQQPQYAVVNPAPINLSEIVVILGCDPAAPSCMRQAAQYIDARVLIYGQVERRSGRYFFNVEIFDAPAGRVLHKMSRTLDASDDPVIAFRQEIEIFFAGQKATLTSRLQIGSNVDGAEIRIEGILVGYSPFERVGLDPGRYEVVVTARGYQDWSVVVEIVEGGELRLWAPLVVAQSATPEPPVKVDEPLAVVEPETVHAPSLESRPASGPKSGEVGEDRANNPRARSNIGAWSALGVGAVALAGSGAMVLMMRDTERELETVRALPRDEGQAKYNELVARGEGYETGHKVLLGVGALSMTAGTVWLILRNRQQKGSERDLVKWSVGPGSVSASMRF